MARVPGEEVLCTILKRGSEDSVVGIQIRYGLSGPGLECSHDKKFSHPQNRPWNSPGLLQWVPGLFPEVKLPKHGVIHPPPSAVEAKETVDLYLYFPCVPSWNVTRKIPLFILQCRTT
jgi:hypothetical protein